MSEAKVSNIKIRRITREDVNSVLAFSKKLGGPQSSLCYSDLTSMSPGERLDMSFVAEDNSEIIGYVKARLEYVYVPVTEVCLIHAILVDHRYREQGIGSMLMNELIGHCILNEINVVRALVDEHDMELKQFIDRLGFIRSKIINYDKVLSE